MAAATKKKSRLMTAMHYILALAMMWIGWDSQFLIPGLVGLGLLAVLILESLLYARSVARGKKSAT